MFRIDARPLKQQRLEALLALAPRMRRLHKAVAYQAGVILRDGLGQAMASIPETDRYADSMELRRLPGRLPGYGVYPRARAKLAAELKPDRTVVYVRPRGRVKPAVGILARHNPWPLGALPWTPPGTEAHLVYRQVSIQEFRTVKTRRRDEESTWKPALIQLGIRVAQAPAPPDTKFRPDLYFQALRLEFGGVASKARPHWQPALRQVPKELQRWMAQNASRVLTMSESRWKREIPKVPRVSKKEAQGAEPFVERLRRVV